MLLKIVVGQNPSMAENPKLIEFMDLSSNDRGEELARITVTILRIATVGTNDGLSDVINNLEKLKRYTDMMCSLKNIPFNSGMLDNDAWEGLQTILKVWVEYVKIEYSELIKPMSIEQVQAMAAPMMVSLNVQKEKEKVISTEQEEEEGDSTYSCSSAEDISYDSQEENKILN